MAALVPLAAVAAPGVPVVGQRAAAPVGVLPVGSVLEADRFHRVLARGDGTAEGEFFTAPVFYDKPGEGFVPVDLTLVPSSDGLSVRPLDGPAGLARLSTELLPGGPSVVVGSAAGEVVVRQPEVVERRQGRVESGMVARTSLPAGVAGRPGGVPNGPGTEADRVSPLHPEAAVAAGEAPRPSVRVDGALSAGRDLLTEPTVDGFKQSVVLHDRAAGPGYETEFELPVGVSARDGGPGVEFVDAAGLVVASFGGGMAFDAALPAPAEVPVSTRLVRQVGGRAVVVSGPDRSWVVSPSRVFPITIDPTYTDYYYRLNFPVNTPECEGPSTFMPCDTYVNSDNFSGAYWPQTELRAGSPGGLQQGSTTIANDTMSFIKFPTDNIGSQCFRYNVQSASLSLYAYYGSSTTSETFYAQRLLSSPTASTNWSTRPSGTTTGQASTFKTGTGSLSFDVTSIADRWFEGVSTNHGFRVSAGSGTPSTAGFRKFYAGNSGYSLAPRLSVRYDHTPPPCPVQNPTAAGRVQAADLSWTAPYADGGSPITGYTVMTYRNGVLVKSQDTTGTVLTVTGLAPGSGYTFAIRPLNALGTGPAATTSSVTVLPNPDTTGPAAPTVTSTTHPDSSRWYAGDDVGLSWSASDPSGIAGFSFLLDQAPATTPSTSPAPSTATSISYPDRPSGRWWFHVRAKDNAGNWGLPAHFPVLVDVTAPSAPSAAVGDLNLGADRPPLVTSYDRTIEVGWVGGGTDEHSGLAGFSYLFDRDATGFPDAVVEPDAADRAVSSPTLADGAWYLHTVAVDNAGNRSGVHTAGPFLIGEATLIDVLFGTPAAGSDELGLEQFAPYDQVPLGTGSSYVQLRTGNVVTQQDLVSVPGQGLNTVVKLTHNSQQGARDSGVGRGWSLSVTDLEGGLDGALEELSDAAVTDIDINRDVVLGQISGGTIVQDLAYLGAQVTGDVLEFVDGDGTTHRFIRQDGSALSGGGRWLSPPGVDLKVREVTKQILDAAGLTITIVEAYEFVRPDGVVYVASKQNFAGLALPVWRISSVRDRNGNVLSYTHASFDGVGFSKVRLTEIRHNRPDRVVVRFDYQPYVAGADNTDAGVLRSITSLPGVTAGGRSAERRIDLSISPGAHELTGWTQNAHIATLDGAPVPAAEQARRSVAYAYNPDGSLSAASDGVAPGRVTSYAYTAGRPAGTSPSAPTVPMLSSVTDRAGAIWRWTYTPLAGNETQTTATRPVTATASATSTFTITARGPVSGTDPRVTGGNVRLVSDAGNNTGPVTTTHNWAANKLISTITADGATTSFRYDNLGLLIETTNPPPNSAGADLPAGAPSTAITNTLSYRAGGNYPNCTEPADDGQPVSNQRSCALFADLTRVVTATGTASQRVADFDPDPLTGQLRAVAERANPDGTASPADRTTSFAYYPNGALQSIDGSRTDLADVTIYGIPADGEQGDDPAAVGYAGYDPTGQPLTLTDADGKTKTFSYTPYGMLTATTDRDGRTTTSRYDERDNLLNVTVPGGASTDYGYDSNDNKTSQAEPARTRDGIGYRPVTSTVFDLVDRPVEVRAPGADERPGSSTGKTVSTTGYFADGTIEFTDGPLVGTADRITHTFWPNRQLRQTSAPAGSGQQALTDLEYDTVGRVVRTVGPAVDAAGTRPVQMSVYTPDSQLARVLRTSPAGPAGNTEQTVNTFYSAHGEVLVTTGPRTVDGQAARQENSYDTFGQQTTSRRLAGRTAAGAEKWLLSENGFDLAGNTIRSTQATGDGQLLESLFRFDALNRLVEQTKDPINPGRQVRYGYNGEGQQTARHDVRTDGSPLRSVETSFNNDNTKAAEAVTTFDQATPVDQRTLSSCNYRPDGTSGFDPAGNLLYTRTVRGPPRADGTDGCGTAGAVLLREQTSSFDDRNWPEQVTTGLRNPAGAMISRTQRMTYHPNGSKASLTHNDGTRDFTTSYQISPAGWEEKVTDWRGRETTAAYLPSGDVSRTTLGANSAQPAGSAEAVSGYHVDGSLQALSWTAGGQTVRSHTAIGYDIGGIRTLEQISLRQPGASSNQNGQAGYSYDLLDRLSSYTSAAPFDDTEPRRASTAYTLDDGGNITREIATVPAEGASAARTMTDQTSTYTAGRLTGRVSTQTVPDLASQIDLITSTDSFVYNDLGEETRRASTEAYTGTAPVPADTTSSTNTSFDAAGQPLRSDNEATRPAGSPPAELDGPNADVDYTYDSADRVLSRTERKGTGSTATANTTLFFYSAGSGQLIEETDAAGKTKTRYLLDGEGEAVGQQTYTVNPDGNSAAPAGETWSWLLHDALGNTGTIIDDTGKVLEQKAFDPHGKPEPGGSKTSLDPATPKTTIGFQSARTDEITGRVMLGQRQYDPGTARFTTPDSYAAGMLDLQLGTDSLTGNRYLFAGANPMSFYEDGHGPFGRLKKIAKRAMPVLAFVPIVSTAIDVASAATGRDFYNGGKKLTGAERLTLLGGAAIGLIPGAGIAAKVGFKQAIKATTKAKPASKIDDAVGVSCRKHSFVAGTLVLLADGNTKPIEDIQLGDQVLATDPETGETAAKPVTDLLGSQGLKHLVAITVDGDTDGPLIATGVHPFWVDGQGWVDAEDLWPGDLLREADGDLVKVLSVRMWDQADTRVYNFTVGDLHTYYVLADEPVLVHNCGLTGAAEAVPDPSPPYKPSGGRDRSSRVLINVLDNDGVPRTFKSNGTIEHAEEAAQAAHPGKPMSRPMGWKGDGVTGSAGWGPIEVCRRCQAQFPSNRFPPGTPAQRGGAWSGSP